MENRCLGKGDEASACNAVANYYQDTLKNTKQIIDRNQRFFSGLNHVKQVVIIGLSFGTVDIPYLVKVRQSVRRDALWRAYYHDQISYASISHALKESHLRNVDFILRPDDEFWN